MGMVFGTSQSSPKENYREGVTAFTQDLSPVLRRFSATQEQLRSRIRYNFEGI